MRDAADSLARHVSDETLRLLQRPLEPGLYLVATPIGNLGDITLRALSVLARADIVYCEDTRHSARLLQHYAIRAETRPFHDHNEDGMRGRVIEQLERGARIALISDAGTPLVSDPGFKLVRECAAKNSRIQLAGPLRAGHGAVRERPADGRLLFCGLFAAKAGCAKSPAQRNQKPFPQRSFFMKRRNGWPIHWPIWPRASAIVRPLSRVN